MVEGFNWCLNEPKSIGLSNLTSKILCEKHNNILGEELDSAALDAFNVFRESIRMNQVREKLKRPPLWKQKHMAIDGPLLERWFLKTLINFRFVEKRPIGVAPQSQETPPKELVEIVFGLRQFENRAGLYIAARAGDQIDSFDRVRCVGRTDLAGNLVGGRFNFRGYTFFLCLIPEKLAMCEGSDLLYQQVTLKCQVKGRLSHVIEIKGWPAPSRPL